MALADQLQQLMARMGQYGQQMNQGMQNAGPALERGFMNPLTQAGLGIALGSQKGGPGPLAGFMQGMQGYQQMNDQKTMRELQAAQVKRLQDAEKAEQARRQAFVTSLQNNPQLLQDKPLLREVALATGDPESLKGLSALYPQTDPYKQGMLDLRRDQMEADQQYRNQTLGIQGRRVDMEERRAGLDEQRLGLEGRRVGAMEQASDRAFAKEQRAAVAAQQKSMSAANDLDAKYQGATAELDNLSSKLDKFMKAPGFNAIYGRTGAALQQLGDPSRISLVSPDAGNALAMRDEIMAMGGLSRLMDLKGSGVSLGQVTEAEHKLLQQSFGNLQAAQTEDEAQRRIGELKSNIDAVKQRVGAAYKADRALYDESAGGAPTVPTLQPGHVEGGYIYMGGDPGDPASWRKQ